MCWREMIQAVSGIFRNCKTKFKSSCCEVELDMTNKNSSSSLKGQTPNDLKGQASAV